MTNCIMVLGADRVGKTTIIQNTMDALPRSTYSVSQHFTAPKVKANPMQQYIDFLKMPWESFGVDYVFMDRGFPETVFYEEYRCGNKIPISEMIRIHRLFEARFTIFNPIIIWRHWDDIEAGHIEEIENGINHYESNESIRLSDRKKEYYAYYEFMDIYLESLPSSIQFMHNPPMGALLVK